MTAFAAAVGVLFADPNLAVAPTGSGGDGAGAAVRVILQRPDAVSDFNGGRFRSETMLLDVRVAEVPVLTRGDAFEIAGEVWEVAAAPLRDAERLVWRAEVRRQ